ncbi:MAG TPA: hypothetical protein VEC57_15460 [Candidatus Limnocylindrales bacterium]|nr:hypothetical protein [Candidatus Limnocylindrales bacterium]
MRKNALSLAVASVVLAATCASAGSPGGTIYRIEEHEPSGKRILYVPKEEATSRRVVYVSPPDEDPSAAAMAADVLISRPLSLVNYMLGTVFFVAGLPFAAAAGDVQTPARRLVVEPGAYTFDRRLGEFE